jgi:hypothetical protein
LLIDVVVSCNMNQSINKLCSTRIILKIEAIWDALNFDSKLRALCLARWANWLISEGVNDVELSILSRMTLRCK